MEQNRGTAATDSTTNHRRRPTVVPIFVVPGILGSRLSIGRQLYWNPAGVGWTSHPLFRRNPWQGPFLKLVGDLDDPGPLTCGVTVMRDVRYALTPDEHNTYPPGHKYHALGERVPGFYGCVISFYGELIRKLVNELPAQAKGWTPRVYVVGYDWRQSNARSALLLKKKIDEYRARLVDEGYRVARSILIGHSMGGIVSRHYCKHLGGAAKTDRLYLLASPTLGAPKSYFYLRHGVETSTSISIADFFLKNLLGATLRQEARAILRGWPSVYELLPNDVFCCEFAPNWLKFAERHTGYPSMVSAGETIKSDPDDRFTDCRVITPREVKYAKAHGTAPLIQGPMGLYADPYTGGLNGTAATEASVWSGNAFMSGLGYKDSTTQRHTVYMPQRTRIYYSDKGDALVGMEANYGGHQRLSDGRVAVTLRNDGVENIITGTGDGTVPAASGLCSSVFLKDPSRVVSRRSAEGDHGKYANMVADLVVKDIARDL